MEHFAVRMASWQKKAGNDVTILSLQGAGPLQAEAESHGVKVVNLGNKNKAFRIITSAALFTGLRPEIIHGHNQTSLQYALLGKRMTSAKTIITAHGRGKSDYREPTKEEWLRVDSIVAVSKAVAGEISEQVPSDRLGVILNGVDFTPNQKSRTETREALGISESAVVGTIVARIDAMKGHDTLIDAFAILKGRGKLDFTLLLAGDGVERENREKQALELSLSSKEIRFLKFRKDVPDILAASDFFLLPSLTEGLPLSILEAMSHGLPIVATNVGGIPEVVIDNRHGFLVPPKQPLELANAIEKIALNPALRSEMGQAGKLRVQTNFSFNAMMHSYSELYNRLTQ